MSADSAANSAPTPAPSSAGPCRSCRPLPRDPRARRRLTCHARISDSKFAPRRTSAIVDVAGQPRDWARGRSSGRRRGRGRSAPARWRIGSRRVGVRSQSGTARGTGSRASIRVDLGPLGGSLGSASHSGVSGCTGARWRGRRYRQRAAVGWRLIEQRLVAARLHRVVALPAHRSRRLSISSSGWNLTRLTTCSAAGDQSSDRPAAIDTSGFDPGSSTGLPIHQPRPVAAFSVCRSDRRRACRSIRQARARSRSVRRPRQKAS